MYRVLLAPTAVRDLDGSGEPDLGRLRKRILARASDPRPHGVKKLEGFLRRIRAGDWRVLYAINDRERTATVPAGAPALRENLFPVDQHPSQNSVRTEF